MEKYNKYHEALDIDCCDKEINKPKAKDNCCCDGINLPSHNNEIEVLIRQLKREVKELLQTTQAKLLCQDKKIAETMVYIKNNLSNAIRDLLDSMLTSGELDEIIESIITLDVIMTYDTVADMKNASLISGQYVQTLGYYSINDGGSATYYIRELGLNETSDNGLLISLDSGLVAELILKSNVVNINQLGGKANDVTFDNSTILEKTINNIINTNKFNTIYFPVGNYNFNTPIDLTNVNFESINIIGSGELYSTNRGTVLTYTGNDYFIKFGNFNRNQIKDITFAGTNTNKCFSFESATASNFYNINFTNFLNNIWLKGYCGYVYFDNCYFNCAFDNASGFIINQHYTDDRNYDQSINSEYIYINKCQFECGFKNSKAIDIFGGQFIWITNCDICNSNNIAINMDTTGWKSIIEYVFIKDNSMANNKVAINGTNGANSTMAYINIDNQFLANPNYTTENRVVILNGNGPIYYVRLEGLCEYFTESTYLIECNNVKHLYLNTKGNIAPYNLINCITYDSYLYKIYENPIYYKINPTVTVNENTVTYDFTNAIDPNETGTILVNGKIGGASDSCNISANILYATNYSLTLNNYAGTNLSSVTVSNKKLIVTCLYTPTTDITNMRFAFSK